MTTALDIDLATLVGDMPAVPCGHWAHERDLGFHSDEPASHYTQSFCICGCTGPVVPSCPGFVRVAAMGYPTQCRQCHRIDDARDCITILGPVNA